MKIKESYKKIENIFRNNISLKIDFLIMASHKK